MRAGGRYTIRFRTSDGEEHGVSGVYQEVEPQRRLSFTWAWQSTPERVSRVTIELQAQAGGCELRTGGRVVRLTAPRLFHDEARRDIRPLERQVLRVIGVADFLSLTTAPAVTPG